jgi:hypothetical protein
VPSIERVFDCEGTSALRCSDNRDLHVRLLVG